MGSQRVLVKANSVLFGLFRGSWEIVGPTWDQDRYKTTILEPRYLFLREENETLGAVLGACGESFKCLGGFLRGRGKCLGSSEGDVQGI
jgi:hypothetical protein